MQRWTNSHCLLPLHNQLDWGDSLTMGRMPCPLGSGFHVPGIFLVQSFQASLGYTGYTIHRNSQLIQQLIGEHEDTTDYYNPDLDAGVTAIQLWCQWHSICQYLAWQTRQYLAATMIQCWKPCIWLDRWFDQQAKKRLLLHL